MCTYMCKNTSALGVFVYKLQRETHRQPQHNAKIWPLPGASAEKSQPAALVLPARSSTDGSKFVQPVCRANRICLEISVFVFCFCIER